VEAEKNLKRFDPSAQAKLMSAHINDPNFNDSHKYNDVVNELPFVCEYQVSLRFLISEGLWNAVPWEQRAGPASILS